MVSLFHKGKTMGLEIELKARVSNPDALTVELKKKAKYLGDYFKKDIYFTSEAQQPLSAFRLRNDGPCAIVTLKKKNIFEGIETNTEIEFEVSDEEAFFRFAEALGYTEQYRKEKRGQAWSLGAVKIEEGTVSHIGHFAELEIILDEDSSNQNIESARNNLKLVLEELGLSPSDIEEKAYSQLLIETPRSALS